MKHFERNCIFVFIIFILTYTLVYACPDYFAPTAVIDIDSYSQNARDIQIDVGTTLMFKGERSYDNDEDGQSITSYSWYQWASGSGMGSPSTTSSASQSYLFNATGVFYVRLVVTDNGIVNPSTGEEPKQSSTTNGTSWNTCTITVVDPSVRPIVENISVDNVTKDSADISGQLLAAGTGGGTCTIESYWGTTEGGEHPAGWQNSQTYSTSQGVGSFSDTISPTSNFEPGKLHYFRYRAINNTDFIEDWADIGDPNCYRFVTPPGASHANLVAWWKLDETSGNTAPEIISGNDGTLVNGPNWVTNGYINGALEFDGDDDYVNISESVVNTKEFTVSGWADMAGPASPPPSTPDNVHRYNCLFNQHSSDNDIKIDLIPGYDKIGFSYQIAEARVSSSNGDLQVLTGPMQDYNSGWHHYALTVSSSQITFYIDGIEVDSETNQQVGEYVTNDEIFIGSGAYGAGVAFNGLIDDMRVYDSALTEDEIQCLVEGAPSRVSTSPALTWVPGESDYPVLHDVYLGTSPASVLDANHDSSEYKGRINVPYYKPGDLSSNTTYYWRVDEVVLDPYNDDAERITKIDYHEELWSFTTGVASPVDLNVFPGNAKAYLSWDIPDTTNGSCPFS